MQARMGERVVGDPASHPVWRDDESAMLATRRILKLARAAEEFGKGRDVQFSPRGAREVRRAGAAFLEMKRRVERAIEQRTTMLNGVSHDLRTIITRFKLSLALMGEGNEAVEMRKDVDEMERIVEAYYSFRMMEDAWLSLDLQHIGNPGYNADRGPARVFGIRLHTEL